MGKGLKLETLAPRWPLIIVAAPGPSLTEQVAELCRGYPTIAIKQAALRIPHAAAMYACNAWMWDLWAGFPKFEGERWSLHHRLDRKDWLVDQYRLRLVRGEGMNLGRFSEDPSIVHYGMCSGFVALGFAIHWLIKPSRIVMVGFDFRTVAGRQYWNGPHPKGRQGGQFQAYARCFEEAAKQLPKGVEILNCTPKSALKAFPHMDLEQALGIAKDAKAA